VALLRELTVTTGLGTGWSEALLDTYAGVPIHLPGRVLADLAVMIADGGDALAHLATLRDQDKLFGPVASDATAWRVLDRVDDEHLTRLHAVRAGARERAWAAGAGPDMTAGLVIDIDATITIAGLRKRTRRKRGRKRSGFIRCWPTSTAPTSLAGKRWPGSCDRAKPGRTPPRTTSRSSRWRCLRYRRTPGPIPITLARHR
jgi:hypothetical protein